MEPRGFGRGILREMEKPASFQPPVIGPVPSPVNPETMVELPRPQLERPVQSECIDTLIVAGHGSSALTGDSAGGVRNSDTGSEFSYGSFGERDRRKLCDSLCPGASVVMLGCETADEATEQKMLQCFADFCGMGVRFYGTRYWFHTGWWGGSKIWVGVGPWVNRKEGCGETTAGWNPLDYRNQEAFWASEPGESDPAKRSDERNDCPK